MDAARNEQRERFAAEQRELDALIAARNEQRERFAVEQRERDAELIELRNKIEFDRNEQRERFAAEQRERDAELIELRNEIEFDRAKRDAKRAKELIELDNKIEFDRAKRDAKRAKRDAKRDAKRAKLAKAREKELKAAEEEFAKRDEKFAIEQVRTTMLKRNARNNKKQTVPGINMMALERQLAFASVVHKRLGENSVFNNLPSDCLKMVLQCPELKYDSIAYINAECPRMRFVGDIRDVYYDDTRPEWRFYKHGCYDDTRPEWVCYTLCTDAMWEGLRVIVLRIHKTFKSMYYNEFGRPGMKHIKGNIMSNTFADFPQVFEGNISNWFFCKSPRIKLLQRPLFGEYVDLQVMSPHELVYELEALLTWCRKTYRMQGMAYEVTKCLKKARFARQLLK